MSRLKEIKKWHDNMESGVQDWYDLAGELLTMVEELQEQLADAQDFAKRCANSPVGQMVKQLEAVRGVVTEFDCKPIKYSSVSKSFLYQRMLTFEKCLKAAIGELENKDASD